MSVPGWPLPCRRPVGAAAAALFAAPHVVDGDDAQVLELDRDLRLMQKSLSHLARFRGVRQQLFQRDGPLQCAIPASPDGAEPAPRVLLLPVVAVGRAAVGALVVRAQPASRKAFLPALEFGPRERGEGDRGIALIAGADRRLYQAKESGRNRVVSG